MRKTPRLMRVHLLCKFVTAATPRFLYLSVHSSSSSSLQISPFLTFSLLSLFLSLRSRELCSIPIITASTNFNFNPAKSGSPHRQKVLFSLDEFLVKLLRRSCLLYNSGRHRSDFVAILL